MCAHSVWLCKLVYEYVCMHVCVCVCVCVRACVCVGIYAIEFYCVKRKCLKHQHENDKIYLCCYSNLL